MRNFAILIVILAVFGIVMVFWSDRQEPSSYEKESVSESQPKLSQTIRIVARNLDVPWSIAFLPDQSLLVTERSGTLRVIGEIDSKVEVPDVVERGEGGLLGVALHPDFVANKFLYLYFTTEVNDKTINRVTRYTFDGFTLADPAIIVDAIPGGTVHNGGRIAFGPDRLLYITTGEAGNANVAQDTESLGGRILRVRDDGGIPEDNPFGNAVYSYGHRNPQGLAWDESGGLWATEHGRSGVLSGFDEVNFITRGGNYGWPIVQGDETRRGMIPPVLHSGASTTWAPSGIAYRDGTLYVVGLRGQSLYEVPITGHGMLGELTERLHEAYGRLRGVAVGPDNELYISTSNRDGRGEVRSGDDIVLAIP